MFDAIMRHLPYPLDRASNLEVQVPEDTEVCGVPVFPEDSDEKITVLFRLSLNDFVALATAIDVGSDIAYGDDGLKVWYLWVASVMCAQFCEEIAQCLTTQNPAVVAALADLIRNNTTIQQAISEAISENGGGTPGQPLSPDQLTRDLLPPGVKTGDDCDYDALWGACLYLVQSGNRAITDFFEDLEAASNTLEAATIIAGAIPAAGQYAEAAGQFADQMQENIAEGYAAAYTETYEEELACALFCLARNNDCELPLDGMVAILSDRLSVPGLVVDFGLLMNFVAAGTWVGTDIANIAYLVYFNALKYGQQFGDIIGVRPLSDLMGLGADQLASDNWETLCDCPEPCVTPEFRVVNPLGFSGGTIDLTDNMDGTWTLVGTAAFDTNGNRLAFVEVNTGCCWETISLDFDTEPDNLNVQYNCGANPTDEDYGNGEGTGPLTPGLCGAGMVASDVDEGFSVAWTFRAC